MKRYIILVLSLILSLYMCACSSNHVPETGTDSISDSNTASLTFNANTDSDSTETEETNPEESTDSMESSEQQEETIPIPPQSDDNTSAAVEKTENTPLPTQTEKPVTLPPSNPPETSSGSTTEKPVEPPQTEPPQTEPLTPPTETENKPVEPAADFRIKITVGDQVLTATIYNNATGRDFIDRLPLSLPMMDLYDREMCYRFSDTLATDDVQYTGYEVGEIVYWPPGHSFVIMYAQNDEHFSMQKLGRIDSGVEVFENTGDVEIGIEVLQ